MTYRILILGASYGSLFGTKNLMAGHDVTLVCRNATADLINSQGTEVRIKLKGEDAHRAIRSTDLPGRLDAKTPENVDPAEYDLVVLAMQEPQYLHHTMRMLLARIAAARRSVPVADEHAAFALSQTDRGDRCRRRRRSLLQGRRLGPLRPAAGHAVLARPASGAPGRRTGQCSAGQSADQFQGRPLRLARSQRNADRAGRIASTPPGSTVSTCRSNYASTIRCSCRSQNGPMLLTGNYRSVTAGAPISIRDAVHATSICRARSMPPSKPSC